MPGVIHGTAAFAGAQAVDSCTGSIGHGITAATFSLRVLPQAAPLPVQGTLVISDGNETVTLPGCRLDGLKVQKDESGEVWALEIVDRRWRWRDLGGIDGFYNQLDPHGKLIPWTIRSPTELAVLCLRALGETNYVLNLPPGLDSSVGQNYQTMLVTGINYPPTGTNPPVNWVKTPPARALQQVAELFGCRVIYRHADDTVMVTTAGVGANLPPGSIHKQGPSIKSPETPDAVGVVGAPTRYQVQLGLVAVGEEWDGSYRPIDQLSYAPKGAGGAGGKVQISTIPVTYDGTTAGIIYQIFLGSTTGSDSDGVLFEYTAQPGDTADTVASVLAAKIGTCADARVQGQVTAAASGGSVVVTGLKPGVSFSCYATLSGMSSFPAGNSIGASVTQAAQQAANAGGKWDQSQPPLFPNVVATDRLTADQARALAQRSVFKCYRVSDVDAFGEGPIQVPGYGTLVRRQQLLIQPTQVDQIVPAPGDANVQVDGFKGLVDLQKDLYNGYSKDKPSAVFGSIANEIVLTRGLYYQKSQSNTPADYQVYIDFNTNAAEQVITFTDYVYFISPGKVEEPELILQCAVQVRDAVTNQFDRFTKVIPLPGQNSLTNPKYELHEDVQLNVTSTYQGGRADGVSVLEADPILRANYYLQGMVSRYTLQGAQTIEYNGVRNIQLDGAISQVSWSVGPGGASTVASRNTEHDHWVPPYPSRRRAELIDSLKDQEANQRASLTRAFNGG